MSVAESRQISAESTCKNFLSSLMCLELPFVCCLDAQMYVRGSKLPEAKPFLGISYDGAYLQSPKLWLRMMDNN